MDKSFLRSLTHPVLLAPLAGISSLPFRILNRRFGCGYAFVEMINARSLCYASKKTADLMQTNPEDRPLGIQLVGSEEDFVYKAVEKIPWGCYDILDFNAACPQKKIVGKGDGAALLRQPRTLQKLLQGITARAPVPVTVKVRLGWDQSSSAADIARAAEDGGVSAVFIHGRTAHQGYGGAVDYEAIRSVKKALSIPVIASGDILSGVLAKTMFERTGCDGVLVARGALGNPWIFREIYAMLETGAASERPSIAETADAMDMHFRLCLAYAPELRCVIMFRKFFVWYTRGAAGIKELRIKVMRAKTQQDIFALIEVFRKSGFPWNTTARK